ncbi:MAG: NAD-dependent protein deacetylase [Pseudomonadota bacterium]
MTEPKLNTESADLLRDFLHAHGPVTVLGGAGISTASGIPDYRDKNGNWKNASPVQFADFAGKAATRRRYWARSYAGWENIKSARPNAAHEALASLEQDGLVGTLITQNVDGLHERAGSRRLIDLHGRLDRIVCMDCKTSMDRETWQQHLATLNADWQATIDYYKPDGDAQLSDEDIARFRVPDCPACGGRIKPDVVFFGENVPRARVADAMQSLDDSAALLVVGSSLMVFSGFRFVRRAAETNKPVLILNRGKTRGDDLASLKIDDDCGVVLSRITAHA